MKLRNKKTGEIKEFVIFDGKELQGGATLKALNEEWEDYEEQIGYWYISEEGIPGRINFSWDTKESIENHKEIGNYFETKEEVERAVEKLKAWKRLKDKGMSFKLSHLIPSNQPILKMKGNNLVTFDAAMEAWDDLEFIFGGEND